MSGGRLNYFYCMLQEHEGDFGDKELDELVKDLSDLFHDREWYLSGDTGKGAWTEARDEFKRKWFTKAGREERINRYLEEICDDVRESLGFKKSYCQNCRYWTKKDDYYGHCEFNKQCLMHRSESCDKWGVKK